MHTWLLFFCVDTTVEVLQAGFPHNVLSMHITAVYWEYFEG